MPGITDPVERYFKDGLWGWISDRWRPNPLVWGYSGHVAGKDIDTNADAGSNTLQSGAVPAGEVWVIEGVSASDRDNAPSKVLLYPYDGSERVYVLEDTSPVASGQTVWTGRLTLSPGDKIRAMFFGVIAGDEIRLRWWGYKMLIAE